MKGIAAQAVHQKVLLLKQYIKGTAAQAVHENYSCSSCT
jgi:hypothetical protein